MLRLRLRCSRWLKPTSHSILKSQSNSRSHYQTSLLFCSSLTLPPQLSPTPADSPPTHSFGGAAGPQEPRNRLTVPRPEPHALPININLTLRPLQSQVPGFRKKRSCHSSLHF